MKFNYLTNIYSGYSGGFRNNLLNLTINPEAAYECANQCVDFPNFKSLVRTYVAYSNT